MIDSPPHPIGVAVSPRGRVVLMPRGLAWPPILTLDEAEALRDDLDEAINTIKNGRDL